VAAWNVDTRRWRRAVVTPAATAQWLARRAAAGLSAAKIDPRWLPVQLHAAFIYAARSNRSIDVIH